MTFLLAILASHAMASDQWFCTTQSSNRIDGGIQVCGMGRGMNEETARMAALEDAKLEFHELCSMSDNCKGMTAIVSPGRTTCNPENNYWVCHRLFTYSLSKD